MIDYIRRELRGSDWSNEADLPDSTRLQMEAIHVLWDDNPHASMILFHCPGDDERTWHMTFNGLEPRGFAYDH